MNPQIMLNPVNNLSQAKNNRLLNDFKNEFSSPTKRSDIFHSFSQPKPRGNVIKVNKAKLPADFFPKCWSFEKKLPNFKLNLKEEDKQMHRPKQRRVQSQRRHISPDKTSFFGFFETDTENKESYQIGGSTKMLSLKRKFQTREQPKRDNSQQKRRFTPGTNSHKNDLLDLFPITYNEPVTEIIISNNSSQLRASKLSPRKQYHNGSKYRQIQPIHDPQKGDQNINLKKSPYMEEIDSISTLGNSSSIGYDFSSPTKKRLINLKTIQKSTTPLSDKKLEYTFASSGQTMDLHNMTFFNAKSSCLPPIMSKKN